MPFLSNSDDDDQQKKLAEQQSQNVSGTSTSLAAPGAVGKAAPGSSGRFTNLQSYVDANKDQATTMGSQITGGVESAASDASNSIDAVKTNAPGEVAKKTEADLGNDFYNNASANKDDYAGFKATGGYNGPQSIDQVQGYNDAAQKTTAAQQKVNNLNTEEGRRNLLVDTYKRPSYSTGQQNLDQALVQNNAGFKQQAATTNTKFQGLQDLLNGTTNDIGSRINSNIQSAQANKALVPQAENNAVNNLVNPIQQRAQEETANATALRNSLMGQLAENGSQLNAKNAAALGLTNGQQLYNLNLGGYVTPNQSQASMDDVANTNERQRYSQLMNLIGGDASAIGQTQKQFNPASFDRVKFDNDLSKVQNEYQGRLSTANAELAAAEQQKAQAEAVFGNVQNELGNAGAAGNQAYLNQMIKNYNDKKAAIDALNNSYQSGRTLTVQPLIKRSGG